MLAASPPKEPCYFLLFFLQIVVGNPGQDHMTLFMLLQFTKYCYFWNKEQPLQYDTQIKGLSKKSIRLLN